jgi:endoglucanase
MRLWGNILGGGLVLAAIVLLGISIYNQKKATNEQHFSNYTLLMSSWDKYKSQFVDTTGRVVDHGAESITTSEGQSYALLRSVWADDRTTFDKVWRWTVNNLRREEDNLFGWKWAVGPDGLGGFVDQGGGNSASDADNDIAYALILASRRWNDSTYLTEAQKIINDIWEKETVSYKDKRYLVAGNWAITQTEAVINPSYFVFYAWREFAKIDADHDWMKLVDSSYEILSAATTRSLDKNASGGLPPNWFILNLKNGEVLPSEEDGMNTNYSYDAVRVPWRVSYDYQASMDPRAYQYLSLNFESLKKYYQEFGHLPSVWAHDGKPMSKVENPVMYATALSVFAQTDKEMARRLYEEKIINLYALDRSNFREDLPYYEQNWLWFGVALFNQNLAWNEN